MNTYFVKTQNKNDGKYLMADNSKEARRFFQRLTNAKNITKLEVKLHEKNSETPAYNND